MGMRKITLEIKDLGTYSFQALPYKTYIQKKASIQEDNSKVLNELGTVEGKIKTMNALLVDDTKYFFLRGALQDLFYIFIALNEVSTEKLIEFITLTGSNNSLFEIEKLEEEDIEIYSKKK